MIATPLRFASLLGSVHKMFEDSSGELDRRMKKNRNVFFCVIASFPSYFLFFFCRHGDHEIGKVEFPRLVFSESQQAKTVFSQCSHALLAIFATNRWTSLFAILFVDFDCFHSCAPTVALERVLLSIMSDRSSLSCR